MKLSTILMSMRKLREGLLASSRYDHFSQRVYIFITRACVLIQEWESYHPSLLHLLQHSHPRCALPEPDLHDCVGYHIIDLACRQNDIGAAFKVRRHWDYRDDRIERLLKAIVHGNWIAFWAARDTADSYQMAIMGWADANMRRHALQCLGRSYLWVDKDYVEMVTGGRSWAELKEKDGVGWALNGSRVTIRSIKAK